MKATLFDTVRHAIAGVIPQADAPVLTAVSGGADSMALLHLFHRAGARVAVAHFDHQTRGGESAADARFVEGAANTMGLPFFGGAAPVASIAAARGESFEMAARRERYAFLAATAKAHGYGAIATGHHADDQAETVLMRLLRGASPTGLAGIAPVREADGIRLVRPLLDFTHAELVAWLVSENIAWREDASNSDPNYERNSIRHELIPFLERAYNPALVKALNRLARLQRMEESLLDRLAGDAREKCVNGSGQIARAPFRALDPALQHRCMLRCIRDMGGQTDFETTARAVGAAVSGDAGTQIDLGNNVTLYVAFGHAVIAPRDRARDTGELVVPIPGEARGFGMIFRARRLECVPGEPLPKYCHAARQLFDGAALGTSFTIRHRRPGDRFQPLGMTGTRKLKDIFNDLGLTPPERDARLLVESRGDIVWIPGHTISSGVALTEQTRHVVELSLEPVEPMPAATKSWMPFSARLPIEVRTLDADSHSSTGMIAMHLQLSKSPLIDSARLHARIRELAAALNAHFAGREVLVMTVLKGATPFSVDLMRELRIPLVVDYIRARSYAGTASTGEVVFSHLPEEPLQDRHVLVLEDILDTGNTAEAILAFVRAQQPASVALVTLLDKPSRRVKAVNADFAGFVIDDHFVVGYGLDYNERYRELDAIYTLET